MYRQQHPRTISQHIPTAYDGRGLGRDDPVWPCYVAEAGKWDADLVDGWNKGMDVILLFAALFSAIVTAFLIESHQYLKPDNEELTAVGTVMMIDLLQAIATGQSPNISSMTRPSLDFQPTTSAVLINVTWFLSLTLSVAVALLAMLVKQWGEGYRFGHGLTPPCVQARTRQARYDNLKNWKTEDIVMTLPVLMHAALGLFLLGLILFLEDLSRAVLAPVMVVVIATLVFYLTTTLMPLAVAFCPYNTPLSSRRLWGFVCRFLGITDTAGGNPFVQQCQQKEKEISESIAPDDLTARALEWLIRHSQEKLSVDVAIRAISSTVLEASVWKILAQDSLITLVAQKFTALFNGALDQDSSALVVEDQERLVQASLYARALANIVKHVKLQKITRNGDQSTGYTTQENAESQADIILSEDQVVAVERGLSLLSSNQSDVVAASGLVSVSAWYTSTGRDSQNREKWKQNLIRSVEILALNNTSRNNDDVSAKDDMPAENTMHSEADIHNVSNRKSSNVDDYKIEQRLDRDTFEGVIWTLPTELSYWRWDLSRRENVEVLEPLIRLLDSGLLEGHARAGMSTALAVLAMLASDPPDIQPIELKVQPEEKDMHNAWKLRCEWDENHTHEPPYEVLPPHRLGTGEIEKAGQRSRRAQWTAYLCVTDPQYVLKHSDELLAFGLAGLLDSLEELGLANSAVGSRIATRIAAIVATQLRKMLVIQSGPITLPYILPATYDIRVYLMDVITRALDPSPFDGQLDPLPAEAKAALLQCLSEKKHLWFDFGSQLLMPIVQLLHSDNDAPLQSLCLAALDEYCITNSAFDPESNIHSAFYHNPVDWQFFFARNVPQRLVMIIHENAGMKSRAISSMYSLISIIPSEDQDPEVLDHIFSAVKQMTLDGLLETLATEIVCKSGRQHSETWRNQIINLPDKLSLDDQEDLQVLERLREFCDKHSGESGHMNTVVYALKGKLGMHAEQT